MGVQKDRVTDAAAPQERLRPVGHQPTSARGQRTRAALVGAARQVFEAHGLADVTARTITTAAGVSYGSFYVYFSSKEALFVEVAHALMEEVYQGSRAPVDRLDPVDRIAYENRRYVELYRANVRLFLLIEEAVRADPGFREAWREMRHEFNGRLARSLRGLREQGRIDSALDPDRAAKALGAMAERLAFLSTFDPDTDPDALQDTANRLWQNALGLAPSSGAASTPPGAPPPTQEQP